MSDQEPFGLFDGVLAAGPVRELVSDRAWAAGMLDFEAALAAAQTEVGLFPAAHAEAIATDGSRLTRDSSTG